MAMATGDNQFILGKNDFRDATVFVGGNSDDAIQIDAFSVARNTANDAVGTFTAWINTPVLNETNQIIGLADANAVEYMTLGIENGKLYAKLVDAGPDTAWDINSTAVVITAHKWHHVAFTHNGTRIAMYVDGEAVAMTDTDATELSKWIVDLDGCDSGSIGAADSVAGGAALTEEFKGAISDVKYWAVALTAQQVKDDYNQNAPANITGTVADLISWWDMKDDYVDSVAGHDGTAVGAVFLTNGYSEIASRAKLAGVVVADVPQVVQIGLETIGLFIVKA